MINVLIDTLPLNSGHATRGIGFYTKKIIETFEKTKNLYPDVKIVTSSENKNIDIIHYPYFDLFFKTLPIIKKTKTIVTIHDVIPLLFPEKYPAGIKGKINFNLQKLALKNASKIITDSNSSKKDIIHYLDIPEDKIKTIYLAAVTESPTKQDFEAINKKYFLPKKFVLYVGDINYNKNIPGLVKACQLINVPLIIVGKQAVEKNIDRHHPENQDLVWLQDYYSQLTTDNSQLILIGFVPAEDLSSIYSLASVYCQPSFYEGFGLPVLEAMKFGCPVVSASTGSLPEICQDAALMFDPKNIDEIACSLQKVLGDKTFSEELVEKGIKQEKKFSWEKTIGEVAGVYREITSEA